MWLFVRTIMNRKGQITFQNFYIVLQITMSSQTKTDGYYCLQAEHIVILLITTRANFNEDTISGKNDFSACATLEWCPFSPFQKVVTPASMGFKPVPLWWLLQLYHWAMPLSLAPVVHKTELGRWDMLFKGLKTYKHKTNCL